MGSMYDNGDAEVQITEQGTLKIYASNLNITADGTVANNLTVPTGKKWLIKQIYSEKQSGTFTISSIGTYIIDPMAVDIRIDYNTTSPNNIELEKANNLILDSGWKIQQNIAVTGHSVDGICRVAILVLESDI